MSAQDIILGSRVAHVRELKSELAQAKAEASALRGELAALKAHFDQALLAAMDLKGGEPLEIWDGWNLVLGAQKVAKSREELIAQAKVSGKRVWIVFDGHDEKVANDGKLRISYTGGQGEHRADKFIVDFVRMAAYLGLADKVTVRTCDREFVRQLKAVSGLSANRAQNQADF